MYSTSEMYSSVQHPDELGEIIHEPLNVGARNMMGQSLQVTSRQTPILSHFRKKKGEKRGRGEKAKQMENMGEQRKTMENNEKH